MESNTLAATGTSDNAPRLVILFEAFLKLEHLRGRTQDDLSADVQAAVGYLSDKHLRDKLNAIESQAASRVVGLVNRAIVDEVTDALK